MAKRKYKKFYRRYSPRSRFRRFRKGKAPVALLPMLGGVVYPVIESLDKSKCLEAIQNGTMPDMERLTGFVDQISQHYTGFAPFAAKWGNPTWNLTPLVNTYGALALGTAGHVIANKTGLNKNFRKIPFVGKYIAL